MFCDSARPGVGPTNVPASQGHMEKRIFQREQANKFKNTAGFKNIEKFVDLLAQHIFGTGKKHLNSDYEIQDPVFKICKKFLSKLTSLCDEIDLNSNQKVNSSRFGHLAFRDWQDAMVPNINSLLDEFFSLNDSCIKRKFPQKSLDKLKLELEVYLSESFGNRTRLDYGTGHELNFLLFLQGLSYLTSNLDNVNDTQTNNSKLLTELQAGICDLPTLDQTKLTSFVHKHGWDILALLLHDYIRLCRRIQKTYRLEPAGSRGVFNIDDFQYLPFLFGAAQLIGQIDVSPNTFHDRSIVDQYKKDLVFIEAIDYIYESKSGPFFEHSFTLWELSNNHTKWETIFRSIKNNYSLLVLQPLPIIQHLYFGDYILKWN